MQMTSRPMRAPSDPAEPRDLVNSVHEVMGAVLRRAAPSLGAEGITMGQFWALHLVSSLGRPSLTSVARHLSVAPPTVCAKVDELVRAGLVSRRRSEKDRRTVDLSLTPAGRRVETRVWRAIGVVMDSVTADMSRADIATTTRVFREIRTRLDGPPSTAHWEAA
jgi:DNA-binding MarR family transcriptional regulator